MNSNSLIFYDDDKTDYLFPFFSYTLIYLQVSSKDSHTQTLLNFQQQNTLILKGELLDLCYRSIPFYNNNNNKKLKSY